MEIATAEARRNSWQRYMVIWVLISLVFRVIMQAYPPLENVYQYVLSLPYAAFSGLVFFDTDIGKQRGFRLMMLCLLWAVVTSCFHTYDFSSFTKLLPYFLMMLFGFCLCYPMAFILPADRVSRAYNAIAAAFTAAITLLCAVGVYAAVMRVVIPSLGGGDAEPAGIVGGRLSLFSYPTIAAVFCGLALLLLLYLFLQKKNVLTRALCVLAAVVVYAAMSLTDGRTATVFCCAALGGAGYLLAENGLTIRKTLPRALLSLAVAAVVFAGAFLGTRLCVRAVDALSGVVAQKSVVAESPATPPTVVAVRTAHIAIPPLAESDATEETGETDADAGATSRSLLENLSTLQGRTYAWSGAIRALLSDPKLLLIGSSPVKVMDTVDPFIEKNTEASYFMHLHSIYFQTLVAYGLPGFLLFAALGVYILFHALRVFFLGKGRCSLAERSLPLLLIFCLCVDLLEIFLTFSDVMKLSNPLFLLTAGYVVFLSETRIPKKIRASAPAKKAA